MTPDDAAAVARIAAPRHLRDATAVPMFANGSRVIVAYQRDDIPDGVITDLQVAVVDRESGSVSVVPFISVIADLDDMDDMTA